MKRTYVRLIALGTGVFLVLQSFIVPSLVKAMMLSATVYVDDSSESDCNGRSSALTPDANGDCAVDNIADGLAYVIDDGTGVVNVASGDYSLTDTLVIDNPIKVIGAGIGNSNIDSDENPIFITSNNVTLKGFSIDFNSVGSNSPAVKIMQGVSGVTVTENAITDAYAGIILTTGTDGNTVSGNSIHDCFRAIVLHGAGNNTIINNHLYNNDNSGIRLASSGGMDDNIDDNLIQGNTIENSLEGIVMAMEGDGIKILANTFNYIIDVTSAVSIRSDQTNLKINYNKFTENDCSISVNSSATEPIDARLNWWGSTLFPGISDASCPNNGIYNDSSAEVTYEPFLLKESYATLDPISDVMTDLGLLGQSGLITTDGDPTNANSATFTRDITLSVPTGTGTSTITFLEGTVITRTDGGKYNFANLTAGDVSTTSLAGFATGTVVEDAFQWGIPQVGLSFNPPITLNIFVGTALNGKTLNIVRSVTGTDSWTNDGIVDPKTCTVTDGYCTFQATKASYYAATTRPVLPISGYNTAAVTMMERYLGL